MLGTTPLKNRDTHARGRYVKDVYRRDSVTLRQHLVILSVYAGSRTATWRHP